MYKSFLIFTFSALFFICSVGGVAYADNAERYTKLAIFPAQNTLQAGENLDIVIHQQISPHWHTYWKNPGDSGAAPQYNWYLPEGWTISEIQYPTPEKIPYGPLLNYGYSDQALTVQTLTAPANYNGSPVEITADLEVLVCKDLCIPEYDKISFTLNEQGAPPADNSAWLEDARAYAPIVSEFSSFYRETTDNFILTVDIGNAVNPKHIKDADFIADQWGAVVNAEPVSYSISDNVIEFTQARGEQALLDFKGFEAIITLKLKNNEHISYAVSAQPDPAWAINSAVRPDYTLSQAEGTIGLNGSILIILGSALLGGMVLNLMPCVFPILSIKTLSLVQLAHHDAAEARAHGIAYTSGVILSFVAIAGALIVIQMSGEEIGWGFQLQHPIIISALTYLLFIVGLNLAGVYSIGHGLSNFGNEFTQKGGKRGAFFTGILATLVATPCTAPFMATAVGVAFVQPPAISLLIFAFLGLGLAFPYLLLAFIPALQAILPKPGAWMETFQRLLAFPMFLAVTWLLWVLAQQVGDAELFSVMVGLVAISFAFWVWSKGNWLGKALAIVSFAAALYGMPAIAQKVDDGSRYYERSKTLTMGEEFSLDTLNYYLNETDRGVFVEMTAAWCITCKLNHASSIDVDATRDLFYQNNVSFLVGDWTNKNDEIAKYLHSFGRNGVPLYIYYPAPIEDGVRPNSVILPQLLTPSIVENIVTKSYIH